MNILFLMDPLHTVIAEKDTSLVLMVGAHERGHDVYYLPDGGITRKNGKTFFNTLSLVPHLDPTNTFTDEKRTILTEEEVDVIFIRSDPPFDSEYLINTWLLDLLPKHIAIINSPAGIRNTNEKIWATQFTELLPPNCVSRNQEDIFAFIKEQGDVVAKPTDGHGGKSIFHVRQSDSNKNVIIETLTKYWKQEIIVQKFIPEAKAGDKRILLLNGEILGAVMRIQAEDDHRHNFFSGGKPHEAKINKNDEKIVQHLKPYLQQNGLYLVGIDVLGNYLTEVNVTSPTCMQEMNRLYDLSLHHDVIEFAENLVAELKSEDTIKS